MGRSGKHLFQASPRYPKGKGWSGNFDPITTLGASDWVNYGVFADVLVLAAPPAYALHDPLVPLPTADGLLTDWTSSPISPGAYAGICVRQMDQYSSASACFWVWGSISISRLHLNLSISISISLSQSQSQSRLVGVGLHLKAANPWALQMGSPDGLSRWALNAWHDVNAYDAEEAFYTVDIETPGLGMTEKCHEKDLREANGIEGLIGSVLSARASLFASKPDYSQPASHSHHA